MHFNVVSLFPEIIDHYLNYGVVGRAFENSKITVDSLQLRDFTKDTHKTVDDRPFGGGDGMLLLCEPLAKVCENLKEQNKLGLVVFLSAQGETWKSEKAQEFALIKKPITLICGRYGGVDQRFIETFVDEEISLGDFILSAGELAALSVIDSVTRFLPDVLGHPLSSKEESFSKGLLEYPQFTRPQKIFDKPVPKVLLSGDHKKIKLWRKNLELLKTWQLRPDLITSENKICLKEALKEAYKMSEKELISCGLNLEVLRDIESKIGDNSL